MMGPRNFRIVVDDERERADRRGGLDRLFSGCSCGGGCRGGRRVGDKSDWQMNRISFILSGKGNVMGTGCSLVMRNVRLIRIRLLSSQRMRVITDCNIKEFYRTFSDVWTILPQSYGIEWHPSITWQDNRKTIGRSL